MSEVYIYDIKCPKTGQKLFRISHSKTVYTHAVSKAKNGKSEITLHHSLYCATKVAVAKSKKGYETSVFPVTYTVRTAGSNVPKKRIKTEPVLADHIATESSRFDGVAESYNIASHGHGSVGIGNWSKRV